MVASEASTSRSAIATWSCQLDDQVVADEDVHL
jgi:hypothetical protein